MAYLAEIQIAVKGAQDLRALQTELDKSANAVNRLNRDIQTLSEGGIPKSISNLSKIVANAASSFNDVALGTKEATKEARNYIVATDQLNAGLRERTQLLTAVAEAERKAQLAAAGVRETSQYAGPIGPGAASSVLGGQSTPVDERIRRTLQAREDELRLQQALLGLEQQSATTANQKLQIEGELAAITARSVNARKFETLQSAAPLALPAYTNRGLQALDNSVKLNESNLRIEAALNGERARGVRFLEKQTQEEQRQVELGLKGLQTNQLRGTQRAKGTVPSGGFPVSGPLQSPGFGQTQKSIGRMGENLALGAGFPLLFGGGAGSVTGSVLGSFVGSGFGGQILGGALGQILDQAVQKAGKLGSALQVLNLNALEESGIRVNANLENQVRLLLQTGQLTAAQAAVQQQVTATTGALPGTVEGVSDAVNLLNAAWSEFTAAASVALGILAAPFAAALGGILTIVNTIVKGFNVLVSGIAIAIKATGEWVVSLIAGDAGVKDINGSLKANNAEIEKARSAYLPILASLNGEVLLNKDLLNLEAQKTTARTAADKQRNTSLEYQQKLLQINATYDQKIREENEKLNEANKSLVEEAVRLLNIRRAQSVEEAKIAASVASARITEEERTRLAREAERATKEAARAALDQANAISQIEKEFYNDQLKLIALNVQQVDLQEGNTAALQRQLDLMPSVARIRTEILTIERNAALLEAQRTGTASQVIRLYDQKLKLLQTELNTEVALTQEKKAQAELAIFTRTRDAIQSAVKPFQDLRLEQDLQNQAALTYARLISEGILPKEAQRITNFEKLIKQQLANNAAQIIDTEATILKAKALGASTVELEKQLEILKEQQKAIQGQAAKGPGPKPTEQTPGQKIEERIGKLKEEIADLTNLGNIAIKVADGIGTAFGQAFQGLIDGSMSAREALGSFFKSVGEMFVSMAAEIIAKQMTMIVLGLIMKALSLGNMGGNNYFDPQTGKGVAGPNFGLAKGGVFDQGGMTAFANGGIVGSPTLFKFADGGTTRTGLMAEAGPEAIMPLSRDGSGRLGVNASGLRDAMAGGNSGGGGGTTLNMSFETTSIGGVEYVSREQLEAAMAQTRRDATRDGAKKGMSMTIDRLQQSPQTRSRVGMR